MPIANENRLSYLTLWVYLVKIITKPAWSLLMWLQPGAIYGQCPRPIQGLPPWRSLRSLGHRAGVRDAVVATVGATDAIRDGEVITLVGA